MMNADKLNPLVSVITPSYNQAEFLEATITSVINQDYPNIEYIVIDGGSTDASVDIIKKHQQHISYWISEKDNGQSDAINKGFAKANGQIVAFLNSDDTYEPGAISAAVEAYQQQPGFVVYYGKCRFIDQAGNDLNHTVGGPITREYLVHNGMIPRIAQPSCFFVRAFIKRPYFVNENLRYVMDLDLLFHLIDQGDFYFIDKAFATYRLHDASKTVGEIKYMMRESYKLRLDKARAHKNRLWFKYIKFRVFSMLPKKFQMRYMAAKKHQKTIGGYIMRQE